MKDLLNPVLKRGSLLLLNTDGFCLRATVYTLKAGRVQVTVSVNSRAPLPFDALHDVMQQLQQMLGKHLPKRVLLQHISVIPERVELSEALDPANGSSLLDMLRWEMESVVASQAPNWDLGWLLQQKGMISQLQRTELLEQVAAQRHQSMTQGGRSPLRLGELAIREGMATTAQIEECLALQGLLQVADQRLLMQWKPLFLQHGAADAGQSYLCCAMPQAQLKPWLDAFERLSSRSEYPQFQLEGVYPRAMAALPLVADTADSMILVELHAAYVVIACVLNGSLAELLILPCTEQVLPASVLAQQMQQVGFDQVTQWHVLDLVGQQDALLDELTGLLGYAPTEIKTGQQPAMEVSAETLLELSVARHGLIGSEWFTPLPGTPPPPPFYRQRKFFMAVAGLAGLGLLAGFELWQQRSLALIQADIVAAERQLQSIRSEQEQQQKAARAVRDNIADYKQKQAQLDLLRREQVLIDQVVGKRSHLMERLLPVLSESINDGVVLNALQENSWYRFKLTGVALDQSNIDDFQQVLSLALEPLQLFISRSPSSLIRTGGADASSLYKFEFELLPRESS